MYRSVKSIALNGLVGSSAQTMQNEEPEIRRNPGKAYYVKVALKATSWQASWYGHITSSNPPSSRRWNSYRIIPLTPNLTETFKD